MTKLQKKELGSCEINFRTQLKSCYYIREWIEKMEKRLASVEHAPSCERCHHIWGRVCDLLRPTKTLLELSHRCHFSKVTCVWEEIPVWLWWSFLVLEISSPFPHGWKGFIYFLIFNCDLYSSNWMEYKKLEQFLTKLSDNLTMRFFLSIKTLYQAY